jgi:hypothetical protein
MTVNGLWLGAWSRWYQLFFSPFRQFPTTLRPIVR